MCAAFAVRLEAGRTPLITDAEGSLAWDRDSHRGWGVGLNRPGSEDDDGPVAFADDQDGSVAALLPVVRRVLGPPVPEVRGAVHARAGCRGRLVEGTA